MADARGFTLQPQFLPLRELTLGPRAFIPRMSESKSINERSLLKYALYPLREIVCQKVGVIEQIAEELLRYATWEAFEATVPSIFLR